MDKRPFLTAYIIACVGFFIAVGISTILFLKVDKQQDTLTKQQGIIATLVEQNEQQIRTNEKAAAERRDQSCTLFESDHLDEVKALRQTYRYLASLTAEEAGDPLNQFIITNLAKTEEEARTDEAPNYCDAPHTGLPEPDPNLPPKQDFSNLVEVAVEG